MKKTLVLLAACLLAGTATAQEEDNIWERPENKAVVEVKENSIEKAFAAEGSNGRFGVVKVSAGPAWITSKMYYTQYDYVKNRLGYEMAVNYENVGRKGWGYAIDVNYNRTTYDIPMSFSLVHAGPGLVYAGVLGGHWRLSLEMGAGLTYYQEDSQQYGGYQSGYFAKSEVHHQFGFGMASRLSVEYMFSEKFGIGLDWNSSYSLMKNNSGIDLPDNESYGITHTALLLGVRFYD